MLQTGNVLTTSWFTSKETNDTTWLWVKPVIFSGQMVTSFSIGFRASCFQPKATDQQCKNWHSAESNHDPLDGNESFPEYCEKAFTIWVFAKAECTSDNKVFYAFHRSAKTMGDLKNAVGQYQWSSIESELRLYPEFCEFEFQRAFCIL